MISDDQPAQPLTDAELRTIRAFVKQAKSFNQKTLPIAFRDRERLLAEVDRLRAALTALGRNERVAANRSLELQEENERPRLEAVQMESGTHIAVDAGVAALQEVKRLEKTCANLKEINDRMAEDRLRLIDQRDSILADLLQYSQLHWEDCPLDAEDCYLCEGYERIQANAAERRHGKAPNQ